MDESWAVGSAGDARNPYATPGVPCADARLELASRWRRLAAALVDLFFGAVTLVPIPVAMSIAGGGNANEPILMIAPLLMVVLLAVNLLGLERRGQTLGKRVFRIRIVKVDGSHPSLSSSFLWRAVAPAALLVFGTLAIALVLPFGLGVYCIPLLLVDGLWMLGRERRCLHDLLADTIVVPAQ
ncbi:RDD family protein [Lysobacter sp. HA35]